MVWDDRWAWHVGQEAERAMHQIQDQAKAKGWRPSPALWAKAELLIAERSRALQEKYTRAWRRVHDQEVRLLLEDVRRVFEKREATRPPRRPAEWVDRIADLERERADNAEERAAGLGAELARARRPWWLRWFNST